MIFLTKKKMIKLSQVLKIKNLTVFAFSNNNFNRSQSEKLHFFRLLGKKIEEMTVLYKKGELKCKVQFLGGRSVLPLFLLKSMEKLEEISLSSENRLVVTICVAYCSDGEASETALTLKKTIKIDEKREICCKNAFLKGLMREIELKMPISVDLVIRTSGRELLSDFLLWHFHEKTKVYFTHVLWPNFGISNYLTILARYAMGI